MNWKNGVYVLSDHKKYKREKMREYVRIRPATYKAIARKAARKFHLKMYGLTVDEFEQMLTKQGRQCAICHTELSWDNGHNTKPHVDHNHNTGKVRAILCGRCNNGLGDFRERPDLLMEAAVYLKEN